MSVIVLVMGLLITGAGVIALGFGIPIHTSALGQTLIIAGATGFVGGAVLIGLAAVLARLAAIAKSLTTRPASRVAQAADIRRMAEGSLPGPRAPAQAATIDVSASAIERLRSSVTRPDRIVAHGEDMPLSPNGSHPPAEPMLEPESAAESKIETKIESKIESKIEAKIEAKSEPESGPETTARSGAAVEVLKEPRLDFLFRSRAARSPQPAAFDAAWSKRGMRAARDYSGVDEIVRPSVPAAPSPVEERQSAPPAAPAEEQRSVTILKSGVVDGMAYTLYADGSIEARLPQGLVRFGSIAQLRAHIESNS
jgi:hypothetical protein